MARHGNFFCEPSLLIIGGVGLVAAWSALARDEICLSVGRALRHIDSSPIPRIGSCLVVLNNRALAIVYCGIQRQTTYIRYYKKQA
jgi:hypothetical protein